MKIYMALIITTEKEEFRKLCDPLNTSIYVINRKLLNRMDNDNSLTLYAWCTKKKMMDKFIRIHKKSFFMKKLKLELSDYDAFRKIYEDAELTYASLNHYIGNSMQVHFVKLPLTNGERNVICEYPEDAVNMTLSELSYMTYKFIKEPYCDALDVLNYTYFHDLMWSENTSDEDTASYNSTFGLTPYGRRMWSVDMVDELNLYLYTFRNILNVSKVGDIVNDSISILSS